MMSMVDHGAHHSSIWSPLRKLSGLLEAVANLVAPPVLRVALALPFLRSGFTRWDGFLSLSQGTIFLFEEQFRLHLLGHQYPFPFPLGCAYLVAVSELILPAFLLVGFATRFTATGLLIMTAIIQLTNPDGWANFHLYWAAIGLAIVALGAGPLSLDELLRKFGRLNNRPEP